jgi:hypothetical protein
MWFVFDILRFPFEGFNIDHKRYRHAMFQQASTKQNDSRSSSAAAEFNLRGLTALTAKALNPTTPHPLAMTTNNEETNHLTTQNQIKSNQIKSRKPIIRRGNDNILIKPRI